MHFLATLVHQDYTEGCKFNDFLIRFSSSSWKYLTEILKEEITLVFMGKPGFEYREDSILKDTEKYFLTFLDYQKTIARNGKDSYYK